MNGASNFNSTWHRPMPANDDWRKHVKQFVLVAALGCAMMACSAAQTYSASSHQLIPPRDPPYGKGNAGNDTMHRPSGSATYSPSSNEVIPPRDPPFGRAM